MKTKDEALKQALVALEFASSYLDELAAAHGVKPSVPPKNGSTSWHVQRAITACREALKKKDEQEPVAWMYWQSCLNDDGTQTTPWVQRYSNFKPQESCINKDATPLYTAPPKRKPLTEEQIMQIGRELGVKCALGGNPSIDFDYARAIEQAHGIRGKK